MLPATPAYASAVTGYGASDGIGAVPLTRGTALLDCRINFVSPNSLAVPVVSVVTCLAEGLEFGVGTGLNVSDLGATNRTSLESVYPWLKASLPLGRDSLKTGVALGTLIPGINSTSEALPGVTGLVDWGCGPVTSGVNFGYAKGLSSGTNLAAGNLNFTLPMDGLSLYEEQFVNYPIGGFANGGIRVSLNFPVSKRLTFDVSPAVLWANGAAGTIWSFNPNLGFALSF
ncbi:MAG TPA: hypothetical protein V6D00_00745 [Pantanalinema sp.]